MTSSDRPLWQNRRTLLRLEVLALLVLAAVVVAFVIANRTPAGPPVISVSDIWVRATAPGAANGAVYLTIGNEGGRTDYLVSAETPVAAAVVIHQTNIANDVATMTEMTNGVAVGVNADAVFAPGGSHLMLTGLAGPLVEGTTFPITLVFGTAGRLEATVSVRGISAAGPR